MNIKKRVILMALVLILGKACGLASALNVDFYTPTPTNNTLLTSVQNISVHCVADVGGNSLSNFNYSWNGTSYSLYDSSLILAYDLNNNTAAGDTATTVKDISPIGNTGYLQGVLVYKAGKYNAGLFFNGLTTNYVNTSLTNVPASGTAFTICFWENAANIDNLNHKVSFAIGNKSYSADNNNQVSIAQQNGLIRMGMGNPVAFQDPFSITANIWNHICWAFNTTNNSYFLNGVQYLYPAHASKVWDNTVLYVGRGQQLNQGFNGTLDAVRVWNRALSASEIQLLYLSNLYKYNATWYDFSATQPVANAGAYSYSCDAIDSLNYFGSTTQYLSVNLTNYTQAPRVSVCEPSETNILQGTELTVQSYYTQFTNPLDTGWFTVNGTLKNTTRAVNGYNFMTWKTSTESGNYSIRCLVNDSLSISNSLLDGWVNIYTTTTTTTTTLPYTTSRVCLTNSSYSTDVTYLCYQETATAPTSCGGLGGGNYFFSPSTRNWTKLYDGNWNTYVSLTNIGPDEINITYQKPLSSTSAIWQVKTFASDNATANYTIPTDCFNKNSSFVLLATQANLNSIGLYCFNDTSRNSIASLSTPVPNILFYEEGMWWIIGNATNNYTLSFKEEDTGMPYNFSRHTNNYLDVVCPTFGSDRLVLTYNTAININTREQPTLKAVIDNGTQLRQLKLTQTNGTINMFLIDGASSLYRFDLYDYTNKQRGGVLQVQTTVNNTLQIVNLNSWDTNGQQSFSLRPNWPYVFTLDNLEGSTLQYGSVSLGALDTPKQIVVNKIDLNDKDMDNYGSLVFKFIGNDTSRLGLVYNKSVGGITSLNYTILYAGNNSLAYTTSIYSTANGELYFNVPNVSWTYIQKAEFQLDNGRNISVNTLSRLFNGTLDFHLIPENTTIWGQPGERLLNGMSMIYIGAIFIAGTAWNPEIMIIGVAMGVVLSVFNVLTGIPLWFWTLMFLLALGITLSKGRPMPV